MAVTPKELVPSTSLAAVTPTSYYTATGCKALIDKCTVTNHTADNATMEVYLGGSASTTTLIMTRTLAAYETYLCPEIVGQVLDAGHSLFADCSNSKTATIRVSGREVTGYGT